jgi:hypothetical protein
MRRFNRGRLIKIVGLVGVLILIVVVLIPVLLLSSYSLFWAYTLTVNGYIKGHSEYCEHKLNDDRYIRLAFTPYATSKPINGHQLNPNDWQDEPLAKDIMPMLEIIIPLVDYEVTQDGGATWSRFWQHENVGNYYPSCGLFDSLNADNFWVWMRSQIAITHDGGETWLIQDGYPTIQAVQFDTPQNGQIIFLQPDQTLLTDDGGKTWHPDPNWIPSNG